VKKASAEKIQPIHHSPKPTAKKVYTMRQKLGWRTLARCISIDWKSKIRMRKGREEPRSKIQKELRAKNLTRDEHREVDASLIGHQNGG